MTEFVPFPKIGRLSRGCTISEKIDGTNASVFVGEGGEFLTGSRTRWVTPEDDNQGFARWAQEHRDELLTLGPGHHYGEWWGSGIGRGYGLTKGEKRFSLFNTARWTTEERPRCCSVVPVLYEGLFSSDAVRCALENLRVGGSHVVPGFDRPEGIIIWHHALRTYAKKTIHGDDQAKGEANGES
jgi:RNA ligase